MERETRGIALVEEGTTKQLDMAELSCGEIVSDKRLTGVSDGDTHLARDIDVDALNLLGLFLRIEGLGRGHGFQILHHYIIRYAREVVGRD